MESPVSVVNQALQEIGSQSFISSFAEKSTEAITANVLYQPKVDAFHRAAHWNCTRYQAALTLLKAASGTPENQSGALPTPPQPWLYEYAYPVNCLAARFLIPIIPSQGGVPFTTSQNAAPLMLANVMFTFAVGVDLDQNGNQVRVILTNLPSAQLVFTARITDPSLWDPHFMSGVVATLGAWFINALARNRELMQDQVGIAKAIIQAARVSDGNEGADQADHMPDWIRIRGSRGVNGDSGFMMGWSAMGFPGGIVV